MAVMRFEDLYAWQSARVLLKSVFEQTRRPPMSTNRSFCDQIQRAAVSTMSNIAEGFERSSQAEFRRYLGIAKGSNGEVRSLNYAAWDLGYIDEDCRLSLTNTSEETSRLIAGLQRSIETHARSTREANATYDAFDLMTLQIEQ